MSETPITHDQLLAALEAAGFTRYSETPGVHVRMQWPRQPGIAAAIGSLVVPINPAATNYSTQLGGVLAELARVVAAGDAASKALTGIGRKPDEK